MSSLVGRDDESGLPLIQRVLEIAADLSGEPADSLGPADGSATIEGWDWLRTLSFFLALEDEFQVALDPADFADGFTFNELADRLAS